MTKPLIGDERETYRQKVRVHLSATRPECDLKLVVFSNELTPLGPMRAYANKDINGLIIVYTGQYEEVRQVFWNLDIPPIDPETLELPVYA